MEVYIVPRNLLTSDAGPYDHSKRSRAGNAPLLAPHFCPTHAFPVCICSGDALGALSLF
jgi:hypothetical protein